MENASLPKSRGLLSTLAIYYVFISCDLLTTYLATPDLKNEWNWLVRLFHLNWFGVILIAYGGAIILGYLYVISYNYSKTSFSHYQKTSHPKMLKLLLTDKRLLASFICIGYFYKHFSYSIFITISNYLVYAYGNESNPLYSISLAYYNIVSFFSPFYFFLAKTLFLVVSYLFVIKWFQSNLNSPRICIKKNTSTENFKN